MDNNIYELKIYNKTLVKFSFEKKSDLSGYAAEIIDIDNEKKSIFPIGFEFKRHEKINWPESRLKAIEKHIRKRVNQLLDIDGNIEKPA